MKAFFIHVKTLDALHISTALELRAEVAGTSILNLFSHDRTLNLCARAMGLHAPLM